MTTKTHRLVFLGAPGSGKGTQAEELASRLQVPWISTGEMLRQAVAGGSELGRQVEAIMNAGDLVDDQTMAAVVRERLAQGDVSDAGGFILDGYPRTLAQATSLGTVLEDLGTALDMVVFIDVPEEELMRRALARQRADDVREVIENRLRVYRENTEPLIGYYKELGLLRGIDGDQSIEAVAQTIEETIAVG